MPHLSNGPAHVVESLIGLCKIINDANALLPIHKSRINRAFQVLFQGVDSTKSRHYVSKMARYVDVLRQARNDIGDYAAALIAAGGPTAILALKLVDREKFMTTLIKRKEEIRSEQLQVISEQCMQKYNANNIQEQNHLPTLFPAADLVSFLAKYQDSKFCLHPATGQQLPSIEIPLELQEELFAFAKRASMPAVRSRDEYSTSINVAAVGAGSTRIEEDINAFQTTMGVTSRDPADVGPWVRLLSIITITQVHGDTTQSIFPLSKIKLGILLRHIERLSPGKLSIIELEPAGTMTSVRVHRQGMGRVVLPLSRGNTWSIAVINEDHSQVAIYLTESKGSRAARNEFARSSVAMTEEFRRVYQRLFGPKAPPQQHFESAWIPDRSLCYLMAAFAAVMDVEISTPCSQHLWHDLFQQMAETTAPAPQILWVGIPAVDKIEEAQHMSIPLCHSDLKLSERGSLRCVSEDVIRLLEASLGSSFIQHHDDDNFIIHQSVLMMLFAVRFGSSAIELCSCPSSAKNLIPLIQMMNPSRLVVLISDSGFSVDNKLGSVFEALRFFGGSNIELRVYPSEAESAWSRHKLGDVRTFDTIAKRRQHWRPETCFGLGDCALPGLPQAIKRNYSCAAADVQLVTTRHRKQLECTARSEIRTPAGSRTETEGPSYIYFHQEAIPAFQSFGEFRVFVSAGKVTSILRTKFAWDSPAKDMAAWKVELEDFNWYSSEEVAQKQKLEELIQFVQGADEEIRRLQRPGFETVHIGGRYDCGISEESPNGHFFVNELTRPLSADTFPRCYSFPHTEVLLPWAEALMQLVSAPCPE